MIAHPAGKTTSSAEHRSVDNLITDLREIARLSELNSDSNAEFRTYLKHNPRWEDSRDLDALVHAILSEVSAAIDCTTCGNCCRELCVSIENEDIERLARRVGTTPEEFESRYVAVDSDCGEKFMPESPCPFLGGNLCTVYEDRPIVCHEFPNLHKDNFQSRLAGAFDSADVCPIIFNVIEELKRRTNWRPRR